MPYRILKQFIPNGQPGDSPELLRKVYVWRITSGSYSGSDEVYDDHEEGYYAIDQLERDDYENYQGWGELGSGRDYALSEEVSGTYEIPKSDEEVRDIKLATYWRKLNPYVLFFSPESGSEGTRIWISGSDFAGTAKVGFGWRKTKDLFIKNNELLKSWVPSGSETCYITVYNYNQEFDKSDQILYISGTIMGSFYRTVIIEY